MLALCLMLSVTYYAQNYAGIIGWSLTGWLVQAATLPEITTLLVNDIGQYCVTV